MTITPLRTFVALTALAPPRTEVAGILLMRAEHPTRRMRVDAVGPAVRDLRVGDVVLVSRLQGIEVGPWTLVREDAVLAVCDT